LQLVPITGKAQARYRNSEVDCAVERRRPSVQRLQSSSMY